jgi:hypothetical protein
MKNLLGLGLWARPGPKLIGIPGKKKERICTPHRPLFEILRVPERVEL